MLLTSLNTRLRRQRRQVLAALAVLGTVTVIAAGHAALASHGMGHHVGDAAVIACMAIGSGLVAVGTVALAIRRPRVGSWPLTLLPTPALDPARAMSVRPARAGPPPVLQVFRL